LPAYYLKFPGIRSFAAACGWQKEFRGGHSIGGRRSSRARPCVSPLTFNSPGAVTRTQERPRGSGRRVGLPWRWDERANAMACWIELRILAVAGPTAIASQDGLAPAALRSPSCSRVLIFAFYESRWGWSRPFKLKIRHHAAVGRWIFTTDRGEPAWLYAHRVCRPHGNSSVSACGITRSNGQSQCTTCCLELLDLEFQERIEFPDSGD
jgi:hypothetical protein